MHYVQDGIFIMNVENYIKYLTCPICGADLHISSSSLICNKCGEKYEIRLGIPVLLPKSAKAIDVKYITLYDSLYAQGNYYVPNVYDRLNREESFSLRDLNCTDKIVVDLGGGMGVISKTLSSAKIIFCVDLSVYALNKIDKNKNIAPICADVQTNCLNVKADIIFCTEVLEHLQHPTKCLEICNKLLKDDGSLIITLPVLNLPFKNYVYKIYRKITRSTMSPDEHLHIFSTSQIVMDLNKAGFVIEKIKHHNLIDKLSGYLNYFDYLFADSVSIVLKKR